MRVRHPVTKEQPAVLRPKSNRRGYQASAHREVGATLLLRSRRQAKNHSAWASTFDDGVMDKHSRRTRRGRRGSARFPVSRISRPAVTGALR